MSATVDVANPDTWPRPVMEYAERWADILVGSTEYPGDLQVPLEDADRFLDLFGDQPLRAYHCSRLMGGEIEAVRRDGLASLSESFVARKLDAAWAAGAITDVDRGRLRASHVYAAGNTEGREGIVCVLIGETALDDKDGLELLMSLWGGEAIYWAYGDDESRLGAALRTVGRPTVVSLAVDLAASSRHPTNFWPSLAKLFVATLLNLQEVHGEAHFSRALRGDEVFDVWHPGDPEYDAHLTLPRS